MKLNIEEILEKIEELNWDKIEDFISSLHLTPEQINILANHKNDYVKIALAGNSKITEEVMIKLASDENVHVRYGLAKNTNLTEKVIITLASDKNWGVKDNVYWGVKDNVFNKLEKLNSLKKEELEKAYDLIMKSKYIGRENFEKTFDYIADAFPELSELAEMFKKLVLKLKKDLK